MSAERPIEVVTPEAGAAEQLSTVLSFLEAHEDRHGSNPPPAFFLSGAAEHDRVELSEQLHGLLKEIVQALSRGQSISIVTRDQELTTQQAAEILGISRPTVVQLINSGELKAHVPGTVRRKLRLVDVLAYRDEIRSRRNAFIAQTAEEYDEVDADTAAQLLQEARHNR